jgi:hypothetical protein
MSSRLPSAVAALVLSVVVVTAPITQAGSPPPPALATLEPGGFTQIQQTLDVNIVFVGYETGGGNLGIDLTAFGRVLPATYRPIHRYPAFYGIRQEMGLEFSFDYHSVFASSVYENAFFSYLASIATPAPLTPQQAAYNAQTANVLNVTSNAEIDAIAVERWLAQNPPAGVDTSRYTIYFVNWYGRSDFQFHVYTKTDEPDADTNYNFGVLRPTRRMIAWGGTADDDPESGSGTGEVRRVWFYDLSAGPEAWTANFNVDNADVDGDGLLDYRMPPSWEYGSAAGYRAFSSISLDLGLIARFVAIDLLFTPSPLYKPALSPPLLPSAIGVTVGMYQGDPAVDGKTFFKPQLTTDTLTGLQPYNTFSTTVRDQSFTSRAAAIYRCFLAGTSCFGFRLFGIAFGDLFLYHQDKIVTFLEGGFDYEVPVFTYNLPTTLSTGGLLGFADDNWVDGTQSFVFAFGDPFFRSLGYGHSTTVIHEVGHHVGLSHPHDGFDYELDVDFGPSGPFYFAWAGDESSSVMHYLALDDDFGQFNRDTMDRSMLIHYVNQANRILASIYASPRAGDAAAHLLAADGLAASALTAYDAMEYRVAVARGKAAYQAVVAAAAAIDVAVEPQAQQADYKAKSRNGKFVDTVDYWRLTQ